MFFDRFERLCKEKNISMNKAITDCGFSNSLPTKWKKTGATPDISTIAVLAPYFGKSVEYMTGMTLESQIDDIRHELSVLKDKQKSTVNPQEQFDLDVDICALQDSLTELLSRFKNEQKNKPIVDDEFAESLEILRECPETRTLLHASKGMTVDQIKLVAQMMRSLRGGENGEAD